MATETLKHMSPLSAAEMDKLIDRVVDTVYATLYGTVAVAAVQGTLGGLIFWWLGLPAPLLWGLVMGLLAVVPVLGAFIVWVPTAIFLALDGDWGKAVTLTLWGGVVVGGIDNMLYPMLVGDRLRLHTIPAFIAVVGGLILFGPSGLLLGPSVVAITLLALYGFRGGGGKLASGSRSRSVKMTGDAPGRCCLGRPRLSVRRNRPQWRTWSTSRA